MNKTHNFVFHLPTLNQTVACWQSSEKLEKFLIFLRAGQKSSKSL
jgi:hypothetical protein